MSTWITPHPTFRCPVMKGPKIERKDPANSTNQTIKFTLMFTWHIRFRLFWCHVDKDLVTRSWSRFLSSIKVKQYQNYPCFDMIINHRWCLSFNNYILTYSNASRFSNKAILLLHWILIWKIERNVMYMKSFSRLQ